VLETVIENMDAASERRLCQCPGQRPVFTDEDRGARQGPGEHERLVAAVARHQPARRDRWARVRR